MKNSLANYFIRLVQNDHRGKMIEEKQNNKQKENKEFVKRRVRLLIVIFFLENQTQC